MHELDRVKLLGAGKKTTFGVGRVVLNNSYIITYMGNKCLNSDFPECIEVTKHLVIQEGPLKVHKLIYK